MDYFLPPRILIAGTHSGVGKTTLATGIMAALSRKGLPIQPYKVGPDYIDPSYHTMVTGRPSRNLDRWLLGEELIPIFMRSSQNHWAVIEGVMGLFDGVSGTKGYGSSADIAKLLDTPVVLIVDAGNLSRSVAAMVHGYATFEPGLKIAGVILNRVKSLAQESLLREALREINMPILGVLPKEEGIRLPERHLGLVPSQEKAFPENFLEELVEIINHSIDLDKIQAIMQESSINKIEEYKGKKVGNKELSKEIKDKAIEYISKAHKQEKCAIKANSFPRGQERLLRLGVALDEAFSFYYQDALDCAEDLGFTLVPFSPLHDRSLPDGLDGVFLGGGFPELHLEKLSQNQSFLDSLRDFARLGKTIYAECGGYIYLGDQITDLAGRTYSMAGLIPLAAQMTGRLQGMGYRKGVIQRDNFLGAAGTVVHGHEFHYSRVDITDRANFGPAFELSKGDKVIRLDGYATKNIVASYLHLNFAGQPELLRRWAAHIRQGA